ncbi:MAG TPA: NRAMP family divalent metal transporter [Longimicrobiales bacterium]
MVAFNRRVLLGAAFLMATSAIGPGFLTQTAVFTSQLAASFGFAILVSIILDIGAQLNIWRIIAVSGMRAQDIGNAVLPGLGTFVSVLVVIGGFAFNIGNVAGCGLGLNALTGLDVRVGAVISGIFAVVLFLMRDAGKAMDRFAQLMGFVMIALTLYVAVTAKPPLLEAAHRSVFPSSIDIVTIVTLVGGTVGGYITFAGGHRLLDAGLSGIDAVPAVSRSAVTGIMVTGAMRVLLFLAALGVVVKGITPDAANPPASIFQHAAGQVGLRMFGVVMWAAAVTSVVGASYTSVSFMRSLHPRIDSAHRTVIIAFITLATVAFLVIGRPVKTLIVVGALNGIILPLALGAILLAAHRTDIVREYRHPRWMTAFGAMVVLVMAAMSGYTIVRAINSF